jgi:PAS domain-containing protein
MSRLLHIDGDRVVRQIELREERYTLGRGADCDLVFDASKVSRHHATLKREGADDYLLIDENSSNHVYVNGEQIKRRRLMAGDMISLSRKIKLLYLEDAAARSRMATVQRRIEQATTEQDFLSLKSLTRRIVALDDLQGILQIILRQVVAVVDANRGFIALTDERGTIERETAVTVGIELDSSGMPTGFSKSIAADVIAKRQRLFVMRRQDVDSQGSLSQSVISLDLRSVMCAPLIFDQRLCGLLYVDSASQQTDFDELRQLFFVLLADQAAIAIENAKAAQLGRLSLRRAEQQAAESEQRYEQLVRLSPDAVLVFGRDKILFANPAASRLLGGEKKAGAAHRLESPFVRRERIFGALWPASAGRGARLSNRRAHAARYRRQADRRRAGRHPPLLSRKTGRDGDVSRHPPAQADRKRAHQNAKARVARGASRRHRARLQQYPGGRDGQYLLSARAQYQRRGARRVFGRGGRGLDSRAGPRKAAFDVRQRWQPHQKVARHQQFDSRGGSLRSARLQCTL